MTGGTFSFEDRPVPFAPGQSVGAALWASGVRAWRSTRSGGRPRGLFCGIGVCFDCLVTVVGADGHGHDERACVTAAREGLQVRQVRAHGSGGEDG